MVALAPSVCAVDIDIREFTVAWQSVAIQTADIAKAAAVAAACDIVLIEVASPVCYHGDSKAAAASTARWQIWNSLAAGSLETCIAALRPSTRVLVSPSSKWTMGYDEKTRHAMAGIHPVKTNSRGVELYKYNHDIRECMAMIWSYSVKPSLWVPLAQYLEEL
jgi:hypothetical protein